MVQVSSQTNGRRGGGPRTPEGRQHQVRSRLSHGVRFQSPVLPDGIESEAEWTAFLEDMRESFEPVGTFEESCVYQIALSFWKGFRLTRNESALFQSALLEPDGESIYSAGNVSKQAIRTLLTKSTEELEARFNAEREFLTRACLLFDTDVVDVTFTTLERREILSAILEHDTAICDKEDDEKELNDPEEQDKGVDCIEFSAAQIRHEVQTLAKAKGKDWEEALEVFLDSRAHRTRRRCRSLEIARQYIVYNLIPDERNVARLTLYQRQLNADISRYLNHLQRAQALRLGRPVAAPLAVDVTVSNERTTP